MVIVLVEILLGWNVLVGNVRAANCPGWELSGEICPGWELFGGGQFVEPLG